MNICLTRYYKDSESCRLIVKHRCTSFLVVNLKCWRLHGELFCVYAKCVFLHVSMEYAEVSTSKFLTCLELLAPELVTVLACLWHALNDRVVPQRDPPRSLPGHVFFNLQNFHAKLYNRVWKGALKFIYNEWVTKIFTKTIVLNII